jgi:hypothetical protein
MSALSSRPERFALVAAVIALSASAACGKSSAKKKPEADPALVKALAAKMAHAVPSPAALRDCSGDDLTGGVPMTFRSLVVLAGLPLPQDKPEYAAWINPPALEAPEVATLVAGTSTPLEQRQAAAVLVNAPFWVAYKVDMVNAPMALGVKELKTGTVATRVIRYEKTGIPSCALVFFFQNDKAISDDAIAKSDKATIDPAIAKMLREDLTAQFIKQAPRGNAPVKLRK